MLNQFKEFTELRISSVFLYIMVAAVTLGPGILIIYIYKNGLFISLSTSKLVLLALAMTLPFLVLNIITALTMYEKEEDPEYRLFKCIFLGSAVGFIVMNIAILCSYFLGWDLKTFVIMLITIEFIFTGPILIKDFLKSVKSKKNTAKA